MQQLRGKILIISDMHLTHHFDAKKYQFLHQLISDYDTIVINGDFWDGYICTLEHVLDSDWQPLFTLLRQKQTYYLYGNHDPKQQNEALYGTFSQWHGAILECRIGETDYHIEHGNAFAHSFDHFFFFIPHKTFALGGILESLMIKVVGPRSLRLYAPDNVKMKRWAIANLPKHTFLVTGHSHWAELCLEEYFANSGMVRWGIASYLTIENGKIQLHHSNY
jgi:predicted phosphodiesterase